MTSFGYLVKSSSAYCFSSSYTHQDISPLASSEYAVVLPKGTSLDLVSWGQTLSTGCCASLCNSQWSGVGYTNCRPPGHARKGDQQSTPNKPLSARVVHATVAFARCSLAQNKANVQQ